MRGRATLAGVALFVTADSSTVEVLAWSGLVRYAVCFVIELETRRVQVAGISCRASGEWMQQLARDSTDAVDGFLTGQRFLILDRDSLSSRDFRRLLRESGVRSLLLPAKSPNLTAFARRFVLSVKSECSDHLVLLSEEQLRRALPVYVEHDHAERHHQGLGGGLPEPGEQQPDGDGPVVCRERLGGLLRYYRDAA